MSVYRTIGPLVLHMLKNFAVATKLISALVFCYTESTMPLVSKCEISSFNLFSLAVQPGF